MDARILTDNFSAAPQLSAADMVRVAAAGYRTVICNRPDFEAPVGATEDEMRDAAEAEGLVFLSNPFVRGQMALGHVERQRAL